MRYLSLVLFTALLWAWLYAMVNTAALYPLSQAFTTLETAQ